MFPQLVQEIMALGRLDWVVTLTALVYVVLSARNNAWCWPFGIVSCALWAYVSYGYGLYSDVLLQVFYVAMGFWGLYNWQRGSEEGGVMRISRMKKEDHLLYLVVGIAGGLLLGYLFSYTNAEATYWDAFTTSFSVLATIMLVRRQLENWYYWFVVDLAYAGLYYSRGAVLFALLMVIYTVIVVYAYYTWRKQVKE
ncbi:MAG: nicotinamide riboside transporter PnuC [Lewinella sp.]|jgi:nicotinamide mononucleotide transporter|uniref:nicotinamide riboside transporter PnuC n=1 Tax=Lewinella sp. TaxID=2004506 RepID=UPI003D6C2741